MGVEHFAVGIVHLGLVHAFSADDDVGFVAEIDDFLVFSLGHVDDGLLIAPVRNEVESALESVEVAVSIAVNGEVGGIRGTFLLRGEFPLTLGDAGEVSAYEDTFIHGHIIFVAVFEKVVVGIDPLAIIDLTVVILPLPSTW